MLVMLVAYLARGPALHRGHEDAVVIDETELTVFHDDVSVLQIAVGDARRLERSHNAQPLLSEVEQHLAALQHFADVKIERWSLDPFHEQDRKPGAADEYAF